MAYTSEVIRRASQLLERRRTALKSQQRALRAEVYERIPEVRAIDGRLRAGMLALTAAALDHGTDPAPRVADIRAQNTALRARRAELLSQNGFEPDCLDDKPSCPDCEDRGWIGTRMCSCLKELCAPLGIAVTIVDMAQYGGQTVSSTRIRAALEEGRIEDANAMLGAPYCIDWPVRHGKGIGTSKLGKPTINQNYPADALQPCTGVYLTHIWLDGRWWPSATGIGRRPTVDAANAPVTCETYVPGYHGDTYGQTPVLEFHHYLCAVRKFGTLQELADLIETAAQQSIAYFAAKEEA